MRLFLSKRIPEFDRVVLIESGSRYLVEDLLDGIYDVHGPKMRLDVVTCYAGNPKHFREDRGRIYRVTDYTGRAGRAKLYAELKANRYSIAGIVCSGEPIMTKWKWVLGAKIPAKIFILNENGDYFWVDRGNWAVIRHFVLFRMGLAGAGAVRTLARVGMFPFTLAYLLLYAARAHAWRAWRVRHGALKGTS